MLLAVTGFRSLHITIREIGTRLFPVEALSDRCSPAAACADRSRAHRESSPTSDSALVPRPLRRPGTKSPARRSAPNDSADPSWIPDRTSSRAGSAEFRLVVCVPFVIPSRPRFGVVQGLDPDVDLSSTSRNERLARNFILTCVGWRFFSVRIEKIVEKLFRAAGLVWLYCRPTTGLV